MFDEEKIRSIPRQVKVHPTCYKDIRKYLDNVSFKISDLIEFATDNYMLQETHTYRYDPFWVADVKPFELKEAPLSFRMREDQYNKIKEYSKSTGFRFSDIVYQALLEWLYVGKRITK